MDSKQTTKEQVADMLIRYADKQIQARIDREKQQDRIVEYIGLAVFLFIYAVPIVYLVRWLVAR